MRAAIVIVLCLAGGAFAQDIPADAFESVKTIPQIVAKIEDGHRWPVLLCSRKYLSPTAYTDQPGAFVDECLPQANAALTRALKSKKLSPADCREMGVAAGIDGSTDVLRVGLSAPARAGMFFGRVRNIDGQTLTVYNEQARLNAYVNVDKGTHLFDASSVAVGKYVRGYGVQTGSQKVKLTSGEVTAVAIIKAMCL